MEQFPQASEPKDLTIKIQDENRSLDINIGLLSIEKGDRRELVEVQANAILQKQQLIEQIEREIKNEEQRKVVMEALIPVFDAINKRTEKQSELINKDTVDVPEGCSVDILDSDFYDDPNLYCVYTFQCSSGDIIYYSDNVERKDFRGISFPEPYFDYSLVYYDNISIRNDNPFHSVVVRYETSEQVYHEEEVDEIEIKSLVWVGNECINGYPDGKRYDTVGNEERRCEIIENKTYLLIFR